MEQTSKCDMEQTKCDMEQTKCDMEQTKCDMEQTKCDMEQTSLLHVTLFTPSLVKIGHGDMEQTIVTWSKL